MNNPELTKIWNILTKYQSNGGKNLNFVLTQLFGLPSMI